MSFPITNKVYVAKNGNDTTGDGTYGNPYKSVTKGVIAAVNRNNSTPTVVFVQPGEYTEAITNFFKPEYQVNIRGADRETCIIKAYNDTAISFDGGITSVIENITIIGSKTSSGHAISILNGYNSLWFVNCHIISPQSKWVPGNVINIDGYGHRIRLDNSYLETHNAAYVFYHQYESSITLIINNTHIVSRGAEAIRFENHSGGCKIYISNSKIIQDNSTYAIYLYANREDSYNHCYIDSSTVSTDGDTAIWAVPHASRDYWGLYVFNSHIAANILSASIIEGTNMVSIGYNFDVANCVLTKDTNPSRSISDYHNYIKSSVPQINLDSIP